MELWNPPPRPERGCLHELLLAILYVGGAPLAINHLSLRYREVFEDPEWKFPEGVQVVRPEAKPVEVEIPN